MKIGIIVAMDKEKSLLLPLLGDIKTSRCDGFEIETGRVGRHEVAIMKCGIGKVNAALGTMALIDTFRPELVINTGVAGGTGAGAKILDVVAADRVSYHDVWCGFSTIPGQADGCPLFFEPPRHILSLPALAGAKKGLVCSGDRFISKAEEVSAIRTLYPDALAVDMESAAIAHVCHRRDTAFVCLRVVSDTPGDADNISQYEEFWDKAPRETFTVIVSLLDEIA